MLAVALSAAMIMSFTVAAGAADPQTSGDVIVDIENADDLDSVYQVDITWDDLDFTYSFDGSRNVWNPDTHKYDTTDSTVGWDKTSANIKIDNHSNASVKFDLATDKATNNNVSVSITNNSFTLATAVGTTVDNPPTKTAVVNVSGVPSVEEQFKHSVVTVTITHPEG